VEAGQNLSSACDSEFPMLIKPRGENREDREMAFLEAALAPMERF